MPRILTQTWVRSFQLQIKQSFFFSKTATGTLSSHIPTQHTPRMASIIEVSSSVFTMKKYSAPTTSVSTLRTKIVTFSSVFSTLHLRNVSSRLRLSSSAGEQKTFTSSSALPSEGSIHPLPGTMLFTLFSKACGPNSYGFFKSAGRISTNGSVSLNFTLPLMFLCLDPIFKVLCKSDFPVNQKLCIQVKDSLHFLVWSWWSE